MFTHKSKAQTEELHVWDARPPLPTHPHQTVRGVYNSVSDNEADYTSQTMQLRQKMH